MFHTAAWWCGKTLVPWDGVASYQVVGGVVAYRAYDG